MNDFFNFEDILMKTENLDIFDCVKVLDVVDSSNNYIKEKMSDYQSALVVAKSQTAGRGRVGKTWLSDFGGCLMYSILIKPKLSIDKLSFITQLAAKSMHFTLVSYLGSNAKLRIKWPNDIMLNNRKVCGILTESMIKEDEKAVVVLGIGLNLYGRVDDALSDIATTVYSDLGIKVDAGRLITDFIVDFYRELAWYELGASPSISVIDYINDNSYLVGRYVEVGKISGICQGIDVHGNLIIGEHIVTSGVVNESKSRLNYR